MQINRHKKHNCLCKTDYYCFFASKKKTTNKGKLHCMVYGIWFGELMDFKHAKEKNLFEFIIINWGCFSFF